MLYSCTNTATVSVKGLTVISTNVFKLGAAEVHEDGRSVSRRRTDDVYHRLVLFH